MSLTAANSVSVTSSLVQEVEAPVCAFALLAAAAGVWILEVRRRRALVREAADGHGDALLGATGLKGSLWLLRSLLPEICALVACGALALMLLGRGPSDPTPMPEEDREIWLQIRAEWPLLVTADSLLGFQAVLRLLLLTSAALRIEEMLSSPVAGLPTAFLLCAAIARTSLLALSPQDVYHLDGPLGGRLNTAVEVGASLLLAYVSILQARGAWRQSPCAPTLLAVASLVVVVWTSHANRLGLADAGDTHLDTLFSMVQLMDLAASLAFLARAAAAVAEHQAPTPFACLAHMLLPVQQLLSAYFLLTAWGSSPLEEIPALVGAGRPFEMLQLAGVAQVGTYAVAGVVQLAFATGEEEKSTETTIEV